MKPTKITFIQSFGIGLLALLTSLPSASAQRPQQGDREESARRAEPARAPAEHSPAMVDRANHGSLRHVDTQVFERPVGVRPDYNVQQHVVVHRDVEVDVNRPRDWQGFVYGYRRHGLWPGYFQLFVGGLPYYYDDGIYYQQVGDDYQEVYPPVGAVITQLPDGAMEVYAGNVIYYYAGGAFYVPQAGGFVIAPTPLGVIVPELPPGAGPVFVNGRSAYQFNRTYYQPVFASGVTQYMTFMP